jgi:hypothetical protein
MNTSINAYRINGKETTVYISFSQITNDGLQFIELTPISNSKGEIGVIFHIQNNSQGRIEPGNDTVSFKADFDTIAKDIRVFYWNNTDAPDVAALQCFQDFLETHGLNDQAEEGLFYCPNSSNKVMAIPRHGGNGGVLGIKNLP